MFVSCGLLFLVVILNFDGLKLLIKRFIIIWFVLGKLMVCFVILKNYEVLRDCVFVYLVYFNFRNSFFCNMWYFRFWKVIK